MIGPLNPPSMWLSAYRQPAQCAFDHAELRFKLVVGQPFFIYAGERKQASVTAALQGEDMWANEACNRNDAARGSGLGEPRNEFALLSICAGHSRTSG